MLVTDKKYEVDLFLGIGGGPEGVLAACALDAYNCGFQGRFIFDDDLAINRAKDMGIVDLKKKYELKDIVKGDSIFCATGITNGDLVKGVEISGDYFITDTFEQSEINKVDILFVIDNSGSMGVFQSELSSNMNTFMNAEPNVDYAFQKVQEYLIPSGFDNFRKIMNEVYES